jgi:hypothetical protein
MSSMMKTLIAVTVVLLLFGGGFLALKLTEKKEVHELETSIETSEGEETPILIYEHDSNNVKSINVKNKEGNYTIDRTKKGSNSSPEDVSKYEIGELKNFPIEEATINNIAQNISTINATKIIEENSSDLSKYGLEAPLSEVTMTLDDEKNSVVTFLLGNDTPSGEVYLCLKGEKKVYSVSDDIFKVLRKGKTYFISLEIVKKYGEDEYPLVKKVEIERSDLPYKINIDERETYSDGKSGYGGVASPHVLTSPIFSYLNVDKSQATTHGIFGLTAEMILALNPTEEQLAVAGLVDPKCKVSITLGDDIHYVLKIGNEIEHDGKKSCYVYFEGVDMIYIVSEESLPWLNLKISDITSQIVVAKFVYDITKLSITIGSKTRTFEGTGEDKDNYKVKLDGQDYDTERYRDFYRQLLKTPAEEIYFESEPTGKLLAKIEIQTNNENFNDIIEFYEAEERKVIIKVNGVTSFKCRASFIEKFLIPNVEKLDSNEAFVENW